MFSSLLLPALSSLFDSLQKDIRKSTTILFLWNTFVRLSLSLSLFYSLFPILNSFHCHSSSTEFAWPLWFACIQHPCCCQNQRYSPHLATLLSLVSLDPFHMLKTFPLHSSFASSNVDSNIVSLTASVINNNIFPYLSPSYWLWRKSDKSDGFHDTAYISKLTLSDLNL